MNYFAVEGIDYRGVDEISKKLAESVGAFWMPHFHEDNYPGNASLFNIILESKLNKEIKVVTSGGPLTAMVRANALYGTRMEETLENLLEQFSSFPDHLLVITNKKYDRLGLQYLYEDAIDIVKDTITVATLDASTISEMPKFSFNSIFPNRKVTPIEEQLLFVADYTDANLLRCR